MSMTAPWPTCAGSVGERTALRKKSSGGRDFEDDVDDISDDDDDDDDDAGAILAVRADPHVRVVGDPGLGKSQMLRAAAQLAPRLLVQANGEAVELA